MDLEVTIPEQVIQELFNSDRGIELLVEERVNQAMQPCFQGAQWQRCHQHFKRNLKHKVSAADWSDFKWLLERVFKADNPEEARTNFQELANRFDGRADDAVRMLEAGLEDAIAVFHLSSKYRRRLRTTNMIERLIREVRRREKPIGIFPSDKSALRLLGAFLCEQHEESSTGGKYLAMDEFYGWKTSLQQNASEEVMVAA